MLRLEENVREIAIGLNQRRKFLEESRNWETNWRMLRELYAISPTLHELWYYNKHLKANFNSLFGARFSLRFYKSSMERGTLHKNVRRIATTSMKWLLCVENLLCSKLDTTLTDHEPSKDVAGDIDEILERWHDDTVDAIIIAMPAVFRVVQGLLVESNHLPLRTLSLLQSWIGYAPCALHEGPIYTRKTSTPILEIISTVPEYTQEAVRDHLQNHFEVLELHYTS